MFKKHSALLWIVLGILAISARPALANKLDSATATANCQGYTLTAVAGDLQPGKVYTIDYNFTITCSGGSPVNVPGTISFTATAKTQTVAVSGSFPGGGLTGSCVVTGTAALEVGKDKQIAILINGVTQAPLTCSPITANCAVIVAEQGVPITPVTLSASGGAGPPYTFTATGLPTGLSISSSGTISGTPTVSGTFSYTVTITDSQGNKGTINCSVTVAPPMTLTCSATNTGEVGVPFNSGPITVTGGVPPYTFSVVGTLPAGLTLNTSTGAVTGTPTASGSFSIKVTDSVGATATGCVITITPPLSMTCSATNTGEVGVPFNSGPITVTGGVPPYTFSIVGTLPAGLTLNTSTGAVTGTPTASGSFSIKVTDSLGGTATGCVITITPSISMTCSATNTGEVGVPFSSGPITVTGGVPPYTFSIVGTLPAGLTLNTSTGAVTGTPTASGSFSIKVTDSLGGTATGCVITITPPISVTCSATNTGEVGVPFNSGPITVTGGVAPYTFSIGSGTLPAGLTLNTSTGAVTGTPTASGTFTIIVTDSLGATGTGCVITITPPLSVTCSGTTTGTVGVAFNSGPITVTGGVAPYTFSIVGTLPAGLTLNTSTGAVTGTPTATGTFSIKVTDSLGEVATTTCPITIVSAPCLTSQLGPAAGFSVLGLQGANIQLGGQLTIGGNVGIGANGQINVSNGDNFPGTLYADPSAKVEVGHGAFAGGVVTQSMAAIQTAALNEASAVGALTPTKTLSSIQSATTITGNGGQNVILVNGSVNLSNGQNLTISGGANDTFIFNISGGFDLNQANVVLSGISPDQVMFYFPGSGSQIQTNAANTAGIFLAPDRSISIMGGTHTSEFISGGSISIASCGSNTTINTLPVCNAEQITLSCPANTGIVGTPYSSDLVATGGEAPYTFSIISGGLPSGLTLNTSNGDITGTPTAANPYTFTAQVVDSSGSQGGTTSTSCTITVTPTAYSCTIPPSQTQVGGVQWSWFKTQGSNDVVWINAHIGSPQGVSTSQVTTVQFTDVSLVINGKTYGLPDGFLIFDPSAPETPSTSYNSAYQPNGAWTTTVNPSHLSNQLFFDGQALPADSTLSGGGTATVTFTTESTDDNLSFDWQWGAAAYSSWPGNNQAEILAYEGNLNAGSPTNTQVQQDQIPGPNDGPGGCHGGNNYTGQFSGTGNGSCSQQSCSPSPITPYIQVNGASWQQTNSVSVYGGSQVNLGPQPLNGGSWSWTGPNGYTSTSRQINNIPLNWGTNTFVATYTNSGGCQSQETFTINME
jgi:hypothetical protein